MRYLFFTLLTLLSIQNVFSEEIHVLSGGAARSFVEPLAASFPGHTVKVEFQKFATEFPQSPMLAEAVLFQARAALAQTNVARAIAILNQQLPKAGLLTDQYRYRLGTAYLQNTTAR